jgi:hypothetical protein
VYSFKCTQHQHWFNQLAVLAMQPHGTPTKYTCLFSTLYISLSVLGGRRYHVIWKVCMLKSETSLLGVNNVIEWELLSPLDSWHFLHSLFKACTIAWRAPKSRGETHLRVSQSQVAKVETWRHALDFQL